MARKRRVVGEFVEQALAIKIPIDPQEFSVNIRFKGFQTIPPVTRKAMERVRDAVSERAERDGFVVGATDYLKLEMNLGFGSWRADLDNPLKRVLDSLSDALAFNDNRVVEIHLYRKTVGVGKQYIDLVLTTIPESEVESPIGSKRPSGLPIWVGDD